MIVVTTTLLGPGTEDIAQAALDSVSGVSASIVIDTRPTGRDLQLSVPDGRPVIVLRRDWPGDYGEARNMALSAARDFGADWAITLDTDERLSLPSNIMDALSGVADIVEVIHVPHESGEYAKERAIRCATRHRWKGVVHEGFGPADNAVLWPDVSFAELEKSENELLSKLRRDRDLLRVPAKTDGRASYYLAQTMAALHDGEPGDTSVALEYEHAAGLSGQWDEQASVSWYRAGLEWYANGDHARALDCAVRAVNAHPGLPEGPYLAGLCELKTGRYKRAIYWANLAVTNGIEAGAGYVTRLMHRCLIAYYDGPYSVATEALTRLGDERQALLAAREAERMRGIREAMRNKA